ncbi:MAG: YggT family protein [Gammaproteobacteria bacterium]|jgi:YggT family protein
MDQALVFLINTLFGLYILAVMLRFLLQAVRADFYNPVSQIVVKVTSPLLLPLRRLIPGYRGIDFAAIVLMLILQLLNGIVLMLIFSMPLSAMASWSLLVWAVVKLITTLLNLYFFTILIQALLSWITPGTYNPLMSVLWSLNEPLLRPVRRVIPPLGGLDLSPLFVIIALQFLNILLTQVTLQGL